MLYILLYALHQSHINEFKTKLGYLRSPPKNFNQSLPVSDPHIQYKAI